MVLLNPHVKTNESSQATSLTFQYGAIKPCILTYFLYTFNLLTFQYGAIKPKTNTEHDSELAILTFQYGAIKPWRYH